FRPDQPAGGRLAAGASGAFLVASQVRPLKSTCPVASAALNPASMSRFTPLTYDAAGEPRKASVVATSLGETARPFISLMFQSMILSLVVLRKWGSKAVSTGPGHTL